MRSKKSAYAKAGVDIVVGDKFVDAIAGMLRENAKKSRHSGKVFKSLGGYASLYKISKNRYIAATTDGVGTKLKLAGLLNEHKTVGIDLVAMSVNDLLCVGADPLFFLDYFATGKLDLKTGSDVLKGIVEGCKQADVALVGGETAEMPGFYRPGEYDLAGFAVGLVDVNEIIDGSRARAGDVLVGFPSSGVHSNGYSLVRRLINLKSERTFAKKFLTPTKIYSKEVIALKKNLKRNLKGLSHVTGSGFLNLPRISENFDYSVDLAKLKCPLLFKELADRGKLSNEELFTTFNMGFGLIALIDRKSTEKAIKLGARVLGEISIRIKNYPRIFIRPYSDLNPKAITLEYR